MASEIAFCQERFLGSLLLCHYPKALETFLVLALPQFCRRTVCCTEKQL